MGTIVPAISGPKRPQDYVALTDAKAAFTKEMAETFKRPMGKKWPSPARTTRWNRARS
jgi:aconitate hydratase